MLRERTDGRENSKKERVDIFAMFISRSIFYGSVCVQEIISMTCVQEIIWFAKEAL